jgi:hypothetical protein
MLLICRSLFLPKKTGLLSFLESPGFLCGYWGRSLLHGTWGRLLRAIQPVSLSCFGWLGGLWLALWCFGFFCGTCGLYRRIGFGKIGTGGTIRFDYGLQTVKFAAGMDEAEAKYLLNKLKERHLLVN